ncbi:UPF0374 protein YjjG [Insulibacter thermoxylanivorax]|uniref:UPF0374 protein YjjG n=1 Tax=Insulibacter thermoxylanivorax TaxID=2749268 RepID=A0A916QG80_9BACL|nr:DUF402 domain-containing protein [Insulibacter thermoxylanivorax]GFR37951.1 UPF0374 protein YjjG [Insulibacter thermoxylanivorax]
MKPDYERYVIKSFKHNGHIHRTWYENWLVPQQLLLPEHAAEQMLILINEQTLISEADGSQWTSKVPGVSFFIPGEWYNIVALLEEEGVRFYCNVASPPYQDATHHTITYIDYDLDVIRTADGEIVVVDEDEYAEHRRLYHYSSLVEHKVGQGLKKLLQRVQEARTPFEEHTAYHYYEEWKSMNG